MGLARLLAWGLGARSGWFRLNPGRRAAVDIPPPLCIIPRLPFHFYPAPVTLCIVAGSPLPTHGARSICAALAPKSPNVCSTPSRSNTLVDGGKEEELEEQEEGEEESAHC